MTAMIKKTGVDSIMIARAAWYNPSIFRDPEPVSVREVSIFLFKSLINQSSE